MTLSAYTCHFARVVEVKTSTQHLFTEAVAVPTSIGIWRVAGIADGGDDGTCVDWDDTLWEQGGSIRASKFYAVAGTILGGLAWMTVLYGTCHKINGNALFCLCTLCLICEALSGTCSRRLRIETHHAHTQRDGVLIGLFAYIVERILIMILHYSSLV